MQPKQFDDENDKRLKFYEYYRRMQFSNKQHSNFRRFQCLRNKGIRDIPLQVNSYNCNSLKIVTSNNNNGLIIFRRYYYHCLTLILRNILETDQNREQLVMQNEYQPC